jgi:alkanesulfonate monooxygenase SsuD/methylene tetrahydromethanopterin reductase-like flavin-dependent oxidoreductase (luciferase family)
MRAYREGFRPPGRRSRPHAILALSAVCAASPERAERLTASLGLSVIRMRQGRPQPLPTPEEALAHDYSPAERDQLRRYRRAQVVGDPDQVGAELRALAEATEADELMVMTTVHDHAERVRSYELLAGALGLPAAGGVRAAAG